MFNYPNVSEHASNEENVQALRSWAFQTIEELRNIIMQMQDEINEIKEAKGEE